MPSCNDIFQQLQSITTTLIECSFCNNQTFPIMKNERNGMKEIGLSNKTTITGSSKNTRFISR